MARGLINALLRIDVRPALSAISAPTIVMHRRGDLVPIAHGRLLADRIPGARMIELAGSDHAIWTEDADVIVGEIEQLPTGSRAAAEPDRVLATVLFTDIVESTRHAAELGGARVGAHAEAGQILVSKTVVDLVVGSGLQFSDCGEHELKGVPGAWRLYAVSFDSSDERTHVEPPREYMTGADRLAVRLARRAPGAMQTLGRLAQRGARACRASVDRCGCVEEVEPARGRVTPCQRAARPRRRDGSSSPATPTRSPAAPDSRPAARSCRPAPPCCGG
jgi:hypothetical protein